MGLLLGRARVFAGMWTARRLRRRRPVAAYLFLTDRCNMRCDYCFVEVERPRRELNTAQWIALIDDLRRRGTRLVSLMGGEPLVHPGFAQIVEHMQRRGLLCEVVTNGVLVPEKLPALRHVSSLLISLDGAAEAHDAHRRDPAGHGTFNRVIEGIIAARGAGIPVRLNVVLTRENLNQAEALLELAACHRTLVTVGLMGPQPPDIAARAAQFAPSREEIRDFLIDWRERRRHGAPIMNSEAALDYLIGYPVDYREFIARDDPAHANYLSPPCPYGQTLVFIDANGDVYPCPMLMNAGGFRPVNLLEAGFDAAWARLAELPCAACVCLGAVEWNYLTSWRGLGDGLTASLRQAR
jgi:MoaA/NifB/PqqE/SkfB family radical SAM enzyme